MQGYIYVEAYKESHVKEAIRGLTCLLYGKGPQLVPMKEMVDAITVKGTGKGSSIGADPTPNQQRMSKHLYHWFCSTLQLLNPKTLAHLC